MFSKKLTSPERILQYVYKKIRENEEEALQSMTPSGSFRRPLEIVNVVVKCPSTRRLSSLREDTENNTHLRAFIGTRSFRNQTHTCENPHCTSIAFHTGSLDSQGSDTKIAGMIQMLRYSRGLRSHVKDVEFWYEPHGCCGMFIQNIVARMNLGYKVDARRVSRELDISNAITGVFPGLNMSGHPMVGDHTVNLFETGYIGITGTSDMPGMIRVAERLRAELAVFCENSVHREQLLSDLALHRHQSEIPPSTVFLDKRLLFPRQSTPPSPARKNVATLDALLAAIEDKVVDDDDDDDAPVHLPWSERIIEMTLLPSEKKKRYHSLLSFIYILECTFEEYYSVHRPFRIKEEDDGDGDDGIIPFQIE